MAGPTIGVHQLLYVSRAVGVTSQGDVLAIASASRRRNYRLDVTGCLLYTGRAFVQLLEGRKEEISFLMALIRADSRHTDVCVLLERDCPLRMYEGWSMGLAVGSELSDLVEGVHQRAQDESAVDELLQRLRPDPVLGEVESGFGRLETLPSRFT
jgi:hypothetical protein